MSRFNCTGGMEISANSNNSPPSSVNTTARNDNRERNNSDNLSINISRDSNNTNNLMPSVSPSSQSRQSSRERFFIPPSLRNLPAQSTIFLPSRYELDNNMSPSNLDSMSSPIPTSNISRNTLNQQIHHPQHFAQLQRSLYHHHCHPSQQAQVQTQQQEQVTRYSLIHQRHNTTARQQQTNINTSYSFP